jgi:hypothetical protein
MRVEQKLAACGAAVGALCLAAVLVRGVEATPPAPPAPPVVEPGEGPHIASPGQLLRAAGLARLGEVEAFLDGELLEGWRAATAALGAIEGCPELGAWLATPAGLELERLVAELTRGSSEEALGALALVFQLAARTEWQPGVLGGPEHAEELGGLLGAWLDARGLDAMDDGLLYEPALGAVLLYARAMRAAHEDGWFGNSGRSLERARALVARLSEGPGETRSALAVAVEAAYPRALPRSLESDGFLDALAEESALAFPELDGECGDG